MATEPANGWTIKPADELGYVIITSGSVQFNQTKSALGYKVYNWGDGSNTTDTGCKYVFNEVEVPPMPNLSDENTNWWYKMCTPLRYYRYPTSKGAGQAIVGETTPTTASEWKLEKRTDNTFNIINREDGTYVSPVADNNTALKTVSDVPATGWELRPAATEGYYIIVSGSAQFNQTNNAGLGWNVYNWGNGTNTTDTGCQYLFTLVEKEDLTDTGILLPTTMAAEGDTYYDLSGRRILQPGKGIYIRNGQKWIGK